MIISSKSEFDTSLKQNCFDMITTFNSCWPSFQMSTTLQHQAPQKKRRRGWVKNLYIKGLLLSMLCLRKFFDIQRFPSFFTVTRTEFLAWLILGMEYYLHKWFLHTTGLLRYHGPQKKAMIIFKGHSKDHRSIFFRNLLIFCLIWTVLTW